MRRKNNAGFGLIETLTASFIGAVLIYGVLKGASVVHESAKVSQTIQAELYLEALIKKTFSNQRLCTENLISPEQNQWSEPDGRHGILKTPGDKLEARSIKSCGTQQQPTTLYPPEFIPYKSIKFLLDILIPKAFTIEIPRTGQGRQCADDQDCPSDSYCDTNRFCTKIPCHIETGEALIKTGPFPYTGGALDIKAFHVKREREDDNPVNNSNIDQVHTIVFSVLYTKPFMGDLKTIEGKLCDPVKTFDPVKSEQEKTEGCYFKMIEIDTEINGSRLECDRRSTDALAGEAVPDIIGRLKTACNNPGEAIVFDDDNNIACKQAVDWKFKDHDTDADTPKQAVCAEGEFLIGLDSGGGPICAKACSGGRFWNPDKTPEAGCDCPFGETWTGINCE